MDDQEFLHNLSVRTNINIELLKDLPSNEKFWILVRTGNVIDATIVLRNIQSRIGLREAKMVVEAFIERYK
jgi:hypothetical protein